MSITIGQYRDGILITTQPVNADGTMNPLPVLKGDLLCLERDGKRGFCPVMGDCTLTQAFDPQVVENRAARRAAKRHSN